MKEKDGENSIDSRLEELGILYDVAPLEMLVIILAFHTLPPAIKAMPGKTAAKAFRIYADLIEGFLEEEKKEKEKNAHSH